MWSVPMEHRACSMFTFSFYWKILGSMKIPLAVRFLKLLDPTLIFLINSPVKIC
jgi:hypothetical protein